MEVIDDIYGDFMLFENSDKYLKLSPEKISVPGKVYYKKTTGSTNSDAKNTESVPDKSVFLADSQTAGRGRLGRNWESPEGCGIWMSIYLIPKMDIRNVAQVTLIAGMAVSNVISGTQIKWPNDVLFGEKKVAGILTELAFTKEKEPCVIVGIGINVNNEDFPDDLKDKATSLYIETGKKTEREMLINEILNQFFLLYELFEEKGFSVLKDKYEKRCVTLGKDVYIMNDGKKISAKAVGINEKGELLAEINGEIKAVNSCEVSVRGLLGYV